MAPKKNMALLTISSSNTVLVPTPRHTLLEHLVVKNSFWVKALNEPVEANFVFEYRSSYSSGSGTLDSNPPELFRDNNNGEGLVIPPRSFLKMRVEREKVPFCGIRFQSKMQRHEASDNGLG